MCILKLFICAVVVSLQIHCVFSVIPEQCATALNLTNKVCCPDNCGGRNRGECAEVTGVGTTANEGDDIRYQWPLRLFRKVCNCSNNYGGVNCSSCKFGYTMDGSGNCIKQPMRTRRSLSSLTNKEWASYIETLNQTKYTPSRYYVVTETFESTKASDVANDDALMSSIVKPNTYDLFIWIHHFVAKDSESIINSIDFAHESTGFLTWHRLFLLWVEREIRETINENFVLYYWDWTDREEREKYFKSGYLNVSEPPLSEWPTFCWYNKSEGNEKQSVCNPTVPDEDESKRVVLRRCPNETVCCKDNNDWPTTTDVSNAVRFSAYDTPKYDKRAKDSFRNYLEGFKQVVRCSDKSVTQLCEDKNNLQRKLHNSVHLLLGPGKFETNLPFYEQGVMGNVAASPNDPIFFNHHTMIDCIMEVWIRGTGKVISYPDSPNIKEGHRGGDYVVPFLPLYKHEQLLQKSTTFGYECDFDDWGCNGGSNGNDDNGNDDNGNDHNGNNYNGNNYNGNYDNDSSSGAIAGISVSSIVVGIGLIGGIARCY